MNEQLQQIIDGKLAGAEAETIDFASGSTVDLWPGRPPAAVLLCVQLTPGRPLHGKERDR